MSKGNDTTNKKSNPEKQDTVTTAASPGGKYTDAKAGDSSGGKIANAKTGDSSGDKNADTKAGGSSGNKNVNTKSGGSSSGKKADTKAESSAPYKQNRELSWLKFNDRVLSEALDTSVPALERLRFVTIFTTNLDEFFMVRVGSLIDQNHVNKKHKDNKSGMTAAEQLDAIYREVRPLYEKRDSLFFELESILRSYGVCRLSYSEMTADEQEYIEKYFQESVLPALSPQIVDTHHPFPHLQSKVILISVLLRDEKGKKVFAVLQVPSSFSDVVFLPGKKLRYIALEDIIYEFTDVVFPTYQVEEQVQLCITRNADIHAEDEDLEVTDDFRKTMKNMLQERKRLAPLRLELSHGISAKFLSFLMKHLELSENQIFYSRAPLRLDYAYPLADHLGKDQKKVLLYRPFQPQFPKIVDRELPMKEQIRSHDILLSYPYESMEPFLRMVREAADDPDVISVQITIYRLAGKSDLVSSLCKASENGKDVTVLIELRARFDEQNNIDWSRRLEKAGCRIIYGIPNYKVHSKVCLVTYRQGNKISYLTQIGTGNYNEKTSRLYTDFCLMTADQDIGCDARIFFQNMGIGNLYGQYVHLLVAPVTLKRRVLSMMDQEIAKGSDGCMFFKMNSLTDLEIIDKLREASRAGVKIRMVIRGICCIVPGIPGETENLEVRSIVGRYLEHSRIYCFGKGPEEKLYIASADFMTRNTERRVEVASPVNDPAVRKKLHHVMEMYWKDTLKARKLMPDGNYVKIEGDPYDSQAEQMNLAISNAAPKVIKKKENLQPGVEKNTSGNGNIDAADMADGNVPVTGEAIKSTGVGSITGSNDKSNGTGSITDSNGKGNGAGSITGSAGRPDASRSNNSREKRPGFLARLFGRA